MERMRVQPWTNVSSTSTLGLPRSLLLLRLQQAHDPGAYGHRVDTRVGLNDSLCLPSGLDAHTVRALKKRRYSRCRWQSETQRSQHRTEVSVPEVHHSSH